MKKIDRRKKYVIVLDVETANITDSPLVYDLGFGVYDKKGNEYMAKSYVITNIFDKEQDLMQSAYYHEKLPKYFEDLKNGSRERIGLLQAKKVIREVMEEYNITEVYAYNASFDLNALNNTIRYVSKSKVRYFFPYGTKVCCIWHMACQTICTQKTFLKENIKSDKGNYITNAERVFSYIKGIEFQEEHTGLEDTRIEAQILARVNAQHKSVDKNINRSCWRIPSKAYAEMVA